MLDFWNNHCGICIEEFPYVQKVYNTRLIDTEKFKMYIVNVPYENKKVQEVLKIVAKYNMNVPLLFFNRNEEIR